MFGTGGVRRTSAAWRAKLGVRLSSVVAVVAVAGFLGVAASPASAVLVRLPNGHVYSYEPEYGKPTPPMRGFDSFFSNLDYSGGPVMHSNTNYVVEWNPSNYSGTPFQTNPSDASGDYIAGVTQFFTDLAHDSGLHTNDDSVSTQYTDATGASVAYNSAYGGLISDTDALPTSGCDSSHTGEFCITDTQLQTELTKVIGTHPRDLSHEYYLLTPPNVVVCQGNTSGAACSANDFANPVFCGYHSTSSTASPFVYAVIPDLTGNGGCDSYIIDGMGEYQNSYADGVLSTIMHEHNESTTDPEPNNAWTDYQPCGGSGQPQCGSSEVIGGEIGDKCGYDQLESNPPDGVSDPNDHLVMGSIGYYTYNQVINGHQYWLQPLWSNQSNPANSGMPNCLDSWTSNGHTATASFVSHGVGANKVSFDASGSTASGGVREYVWQFNDDVTPGDTPQQSTIETTSPTISHTFPRAGTYDVVLTVMSSDGTSGVAGHNVNSSSVQSPPTASFTFSPASPTAGTAVSFDGSGSTDPSGTITSYSWNFGDGSTGSGEATSHTFAAGTYTVTLTVTDSGDGQSSSPTSHTITVASTGGGVGGGGGGGGGGGTVGGGTTGTTGTGPTVTISGTSPSATCTVPKLRGDSLRGARKALAKAGCAVGKVTKPKHKPKRAAGKHKKWALVVGGESPRSGKTVARGTKVNLTLVWKAIRH